MSTINLHHGDSLAAMRGMADNAYELAINRLENIQRSEEDTFNLALAYESIAENRQAAKYYREALNQSPGNKTYQNALKRVQKR